MGSVVRSRCGDDMLYLGIGKGGDDNVFRHAVLQKVTVVPNLLLSPLDKVEHDGYTRVVAIRSEEVDQVWPTLLGAKS